MAKRKTPVSSGRPQRAALDAKGHEVPDSKPHTAPLKLRRAPTQFEQMKQLIRSQEFARQFDGEESFEEADDFDVGDDFDPSSPYEEHFEGEFEYYREQRQEAKKEETQRRRKARSAKKDDLDPEPAQRPKWRGNEEKTTPAADRQTAASTTSREKRDDHS